MNFFTLVILAIGYFLTKRTPWTIEFVINFFYFMNSAFYIYQSYARSKDESLSPEEQQ